MGIEYDYGQQGHYSMKSETRPLECTVRIKNQNMVYVVL
jgi:hypothetical protein